MPFLQRSVLHCISSDCKGAESQVTKRCRTATPHCRSHSAATVHDQTDMMLCSRTPAPLLPHLFLAVADTAQICL